MGFSFFFEMNSSFFPQGHTFTITFEALNGFWRNSVFIFGCFRGSKECHARSSKHKTCFPSAECSLKKKFLHCIFCFDFMSERMRENDGLPFYLLHTLGLILNCQGCNSLTSCLRAHTHTLSSRLQYQELIYHHTPWLGAFQTHQDHWSRSPDPGWNDC